MSWISHRLFIPVSLVILNVIIKSICLTDSSICIDEPFSIYHAQFDLNYLVDYLKNYNNPPLFEVVLHFWIKLFGISPLSVRVMPMLFSSISVFFLFQLVIKFFNKRTAMVSSLIFTLSSHNLWYAHDCRVYTLFTLFTIISYYLFFNMIQVNTNSKTKTVVFLALINSLLVYAHYFGFFVWLVQFVIVIFYYPRTIDVIKDYIKVIIISLALYLPQIITFINRTTASVSNGTWVEPPNGIESIYNMLWYFCNEPVPTVLCIILLVCAIIKYVFSKKNLTTNPFSKYVVMWVTIPFFLMFTISYKVPMFIERYLLFVTPAFYILLALSVSLLFKYSKLYYITALALIGIFFFSMPLNPSKKNNLKDVLEYIKSKKTTETAVIVSIPNFYINFAYHYNINIFKIRNQSQEYKELLDNLKKENILFLEHLNAESTSFFKNYKKIVYLDDKSELYRPMKGNLEVICNNYKFEEKAFFYRKYDVYCFTKK